MSQTLRASQSSRWDFFPSYTYIVQEDTAWFQIFTVYNLCTYTHVRVTKLGHDATFTEVLGEFFRGDCLANIVF
jgi:hypothetical protein